MQFYFLNLSFFLNFTAVKISFIFFILFKLFSQLVTQLILFFHINSLIIDIHLTLFASPIQNKLKPLLFKQSLTYFLINFLLCLPAHRNVNNRALHSMTQLAGSIVLLRSFVSVDDVRPRFSP